MIDADLFSFFILFVQFLRNCFACLADIILFFYFPVADLMRLSLVCFNLLFVNCA